MLLNQISDTPLMKIGCSQHTTMGVDRQGRLWSWGQNDQYLNHESIDPSIVHGLDGQYVCDIACGKQFMIALVVAVNTTIPVDGNDDSDPEPVPEPKEEKLEPMHTSTDDDAYFNKGTLRSKLRVALVSEEAIDIIGFITKTESLGRTLDSTRATLESMIEYLPDLFCFLITDSGNEFVPVSVKQEKQLGLSDIVFNDRIFLRQIRKKTSRRYRVMIQIEGDSEPCAKLKFPGENKDLITLKVIR